jgi:hypothetical protein
VAPPKGAVSGSTPKDSTFVTTQKATTKEKRKQVIGSIGTETITVEDLPKEAVRDEAKIIENEKKKTEKKKREKKADKPTPKSPKNP